MSPQAAPHKPVLLDEVVDALNLSEGRLVVDGTFGAGGYSRAFLAAGADVVAIDRDPSAARFAGPLEVSHPHKFRFSPAASPTWNITWRSAVTPPATGWRWISACRRCSSTRPTGAFPSCATGLWTCAWAQTAAAPRI